MADLIVRVRQTAPSPFGYEDGDVIEAFDDLRISYIWASWLWRNNRTILGEAWEDIMHPLREVPWGKGTRQKRLTEVDNPAALNAFWQEVERLTPHRRTDFLELPFDGRVLRNNIAIRVNDFDVPTREMLQASLETEPETGRPTMLRRRNVSVNWRSLPGINIARALDPLDAYDARPGNSPRDPANRVHTLADIIQQKGPL